MKMLHKNVPLLFLEIIPYVMTSVFVVHRSGERVEDTGTTSECTGMQGGIPFTGAKAREASDA